MKSRAQSSVELIIILSITLVVFLYIVQYSAGAASYADSSLKMLKAKTSVRDIALEADRLYSQGHGARSRVTFYLPGNVNSTTISDHAIVVRLDVGEGFTDVVGTSKAPLCGHLSIESGSSVVDLRYIGGCVHIGSVLTDISPAALYFDLGINESNSSVFSVFNLADYDTFINVSFSRGSIPDTVSVSINATEANLTVGGSANFTVNVSVPMLVSPGSFTGIYTIDTIVNDSIVDSVDLILDLSITANYTPGALATYADVWDLGNISIGTWISRSFFVCNNLPDAQNVTLTVGDYLSVESLYAISVLSSQNRFNETLDLATIDNTTDITALVSEYDTQRAVLSGLTLSESHWVDLSFSAEIPDDKVVTYSSLNIGHYESSTDVEILVKIWNGSELVTVCDEDEIPDRVGSSVEGIDSCLLNDYIYNPHVANNASIMILYRSTSSGPKQARLNSAHLEAAYATSSVIKGNLTKTMVVEVPPFDCTPVEVYLYTFADDTPGFYSSVLSTVSAVGYDLSMAIWKLIDDLPPQWSGLFQSASQVMVDTPVSLGAFWTDTALLSSATLSTNKTGAWTDEAVMSLSGSSAWSNFVFNTHGLCGATVFWKITARDGVNNFNTTNISSFDVISAIRGFNQSGTTILNGTALDSPDYLNANDSVYFTVLSHPTPGVFSLDSFPQDGSPLLVKGSVSAGLPSDLDSFDAATYDLASSIQLATSNYPSSYSALNGTYVSGAVSDLESDDAALMYFNTSASTQLTELLNDSSFDSQGSVGPATSPWRESFIPSVSKKDYTYNRYDSFEALGVGALPSSASASEPWYKREASSESWSVPDAYDSTAVAQGSAYTASKGLALRTREISPNKNAGTIASQSSSYFWKSPPVMTGSDQIFLKAWQRIAVIGTGNQGDGSPLFAGIAIELEGTSAGNTYHLFYYMRGNVSGGSSTPTEIDPYHKWISLGNATEGLWYDANGETIGAPRDIYADVSSQFGSAVADNFQVTLISVIAYEETSTFPTSKKYVDISADFDDVQLIVRDQIYLNSLDTLDTSSGTGSSLQLLLRAPGGVTSETATPSSGSTYYWVGEPSSKFLFPLMNTSDRVNLSWAYHFDSGSDEYLSRSSFSGLSVRVRFTLSGSKYLNYVYLLNGTVPSDTASEKWISLGAPSVSWAIDKRDLSADIFSKFGQYPDSIDEAGPYLVTSVPSYSDPQNPKFSAHFDDLSLSKDRIIHYHSNIEYFFSSVPLDTLNVTYVGRYDVSGVNQSILLYNYSSFSYVLLDNFTSGPADTDQTRSFDAVSSDFLNSGSVKLLVTSIAAEQAIHGVNQVNLSTPDALDHYTEVYYNSSNIDINPYSVTSIYIPVRFRSTENASISFGIYNYTSGTWSDCVSSAVSAGVWNLWYCNVSTLDFLSSNTTRVRLLSISSQNNTVQNDYLRFNVSSTNTSYALQILHAADLPVNVSSLNVTLAWSSSVNITYYYDAYNFTGSSWFNCFSGPVSSLRTSTCALPPGEFINSTDSVLVRLRTPQTLANHTSYEDYLQFNVAWC